MRLPDNLVWHNVGPRRPRQILRSIRRIMRDEKPDALALFEARRALPLIRRKFAGKGWRIHTTGDVVLLVRTDVEQPTVQPAGHDVEWKGPKEGLEHQGRRHMVATWGEAMRWVLMHGVPGGPSGGVGPHLEQPGRPFGYNRRAWHADEIAVRKAVRDFPGAVLLAGDLNGEADELADRFERLRIRNIGTNAKVDHAGERDLDADATRLENYKSDHPAVRIDMEIAA